MINLLRLSLTFRTDPLMNGGTLLKCECGWQGPLREATEVLYKKRDGSIEACHYVCKRKDCMKILAEDSIKTPVSLIDQANQTWLPASEREEP